MSTEFSRPIVDIITVANRLCAVTRARRAYLAGKLAWADMAPWIQQALRDESRASWDDFEARNRALPADQQVD